MARRRKDDGEKPKRLNKSEMQRALRIFSFLKPYIIPFIIGLFVLALSSLTFLVFPEVGGEMIDIAQGKGRYGFSLNKIGLILLVVLIVQAGLSFIRVYMFAIVSEKGMADIRKALYTRLISLPMTFFDKNRVGELSSRSASDVQQMQDTLSITLAEFVRQIILLLSGVIYLFVMTPKLTLTMLAVFPVVILIAFFFGRFIRRLSKERQDALASTNTIIVETLQSIIPVKSFANEAFESSRYGKSIDKVVSISLRFARIRGVFITFIIAVLFGTMFFMVWRGAHLVADDVITAGDLVRFFVVMAVVGGALASLGDFYTQILKALGATERIVEILETEPEVDLEVASQPLVLQGDVEFSDVKFSYPTREDVQVLNGVNLQAKPGSTIALVGPSGAGKSTIIQLILEFYHPSSGQILVDGQRLADLDITAYRENVALVPQEVILFGGTIRENIEYGKPGASAAEIESAAAQANALTFIQEFPEGMETIVGERGVKLSGGQRQRIAIARAILRDPAILLLDEATSSLDAESERVVQEALQRLMKGRTSIVIAHRLSTIREADCIYVIDKGRVVESGTHNELTSTDGLYSQLAALQFDAVEEH